MDADTPNQCGTGSNVSGLGMNEGLTAVQQWHSMSMSRQIILENARIVVITVFRGRQHLRLQTDAIQSLARFTERSSYDLAESPPERRRRHCCIIIWSRRG